MNNITVKPADLIGDCIRWETAKRKAAEIDTAEIEKKTAEVFPAEKLEEIKRATDNFIKNLFQNNGGSKHD